MAKQINKPLDQLTKPEIQELIDACTNFEAGKILGPGNEGSEVTLFRSSKFGWYWPTKEDFKIEVGALTNTSNIIAAEKILEKQLILPPQQPPQARPGKEELETLEESEAAQKAKGKEAAQKGVDRVQQFLDQEQKRAERLKEILEKQNLKAKVEKQATAEELPNEKAEALKTLKEKAIENQQETTVQLAEEIKTRIAKDTPPEVLDQVAKEVAYDAVQVLVDDPETSPIHQVAYFQAVAKNPQVIQKVVKDPNLAKEVSQIAVNLADFKTTQLEQSKKIFASAFGNDSANYLFQSRIVTLSETPTPEYDQIYSLSNVPSYHVQNLSNQSGILNVVQDVGFDKAQGLIKSQLGTIIDQRIAALPKGHFLQSEMVKNTLQAFSLGPPVNWVVAEGASPVVQFAVSRGYGPFLGMVQSATGLKFGISKAVTAGAGKAVAGVAAKKGIAGAVSKLVVGAGALTSWATAGLSLIASWLVGKVIDKIPWHKVKKILPFIVGGILLPFFGPVAAVAGGVGAAFLGGASLGGIGAGAAAFFWTLGRAAAITIGTPVIVALLVFPVIVALILFIINSGAYIVPPSPYSALQGFDNPYMSVTKTANPDKIGNPSGKITVTYTVEITALKSPLTNIKISSQSCKVTKKNKSAANCPIEKISDIPSDTTVSPATPYSFTFTADVGSNLADSIIFDTIEITADSPEQSGVTTSGSETICVGDCPTSCAKAVDNADTWPENSRSNIENAALALEGGYPSFMVQVCAEGEVNLCYKPSAATTGGWHVHHTDGDKCDIYYNGKVLSNEPNALFMLTHELTHHIQNISGVESLYSQSGGAKELPICSYPNPVTGKWPSEGMAEANGLYVSIPSWAGCVGDFKSKYPLNYNFAKGFMR